MANYIPLQIDRDTGHIVAKPIRFHVPTGLYFTFGYVHVQEFVALEWVVQHNAGTKYSVVQIFDEDNVEILPDETELVDENTVIVRFNTEQAGTALLVLFIEPQE